MGLFTLLEIK